MAENVLLEERRGNSVCLTLNRPGARNALDLELIEALTASVGRLARQEEVRAILITGEGTCFCAGADLATLRDLRDAEVGDNLADCARLKALFLALVRCPKPLIAAVNGPALAGGCGLASLCDFILASPEATFGYPEVRVGFVAAMVLVFLSRQLGERRTREMLISGRTYTAHQMEQWGLVHQVVPSELLRDEAFSLAHQICAGGPQSLALAKELLLRTSGLPIEAAIELAADANVFARENPEMREGLDSFFQKRSPAWKPK